MPKQNLKAVDVSAEEDKNEEAAEKIIEELARNKFGHYKINKKAMTNEISLKNKLKANEPLFKKTAFEE